ncbi:MAG TPA: MFS transporter [Candidatus Binataceae bacterium]|nr:MFS transporter [Candidatus Binataceae bacterium]
MQEPEPLQSAITESVREQPASPKGARLGAFRALRHRNFRLFFFGQLTSLVGTWMQIVAQGWLVLRLSNSPFKLGLVSFSSYVPLLLVTVFAGVVVDHVDRRRLIVITQTCLMCSAFVLAALTWARVVRVEHIIILASFNGLVNAFDLPGRQTFLVEMVGGRREDLPNAIALNSMTFNGARAIGPAIAGLMLMVISESGCFFLNGISYMAVIWSLLEMDLPARQMQRFGSTMLKRVREGFSYAAHHPATLNLLIAVALIMGLGMQYSVLVPVFARNVLHGQARTYGFLMAAQGIGALCGAVVLSWRSHEPAQIRQHLAAGACLLGSAIVIFGLSRWMALSVAAQMMVGAGMINYVASTNTLVQLFVSDELRGRVMSLYTMSLMGLAPLGSLEVGFIGQHLSPELAVVMAGSIALMSAAFLISRLKIMAAARVAH